MVTEETSETIELPKPAFSRDGVTIHLGDCREILRGLPANSVHCCVTSPPYFGLRDYGCDGQIGLESTPAEFVAQMVAVFREVRRVLRDDGTLWLNLGDSTYSGNGQPCGSDPRSRNRDWMRKTKRWLDTPGMGLPKKSLLGIPWRVAHAMQDDGWTIRQEIIWARPSAFVEPSVTDRPYRQHETIFLMSKSRRYWFCRENLAEESVWTIEPERAMRGHIAPFPRELVRRCLNAGCPEAGVVLDPFTGSGTTAEVARKNGCHFVGCELNPEYLKLAADRFKQRSLMLQ